MCVRERVGHEGQTTLEQFKQAGNCSVQRPVQCMHPLTSRFYFSLFLLVACNNGVSSKLTHLARYASWGTARRHVHLDISGETTAPVSFALPTLVIKQE